VRWRIEEKPWTLKKYLMNIIKREYNRFSIVEV
jgi:hypothetical protein